MNYLDIVLALPLLWGAYRGFTKGLIISVASLVALVAGVFVAVHFSDFFSSYFDRWFHPDPKHLKILSFSITFILVVLLVRLTGWLLDRMIKAAALGFPNRLLGVLFNLIKWTLILSVLISIAGSFEYTRNIPDQKVKDESVMYKPISKVAPFLFPFLSFENVRQKIQDSAHPSEPKEGV
jgi:membrane protein required for colicin V production